jgi:hypothetical protein
MLDSLLSGFRALDLTDEKGFVCGKILAALGVETIKVEPPGGDPARGVPPYIHNQPDINKSLYWLAFNTNKRSITLNLEAAEARSYSRNWSPGLTLLSSRSNPVIWTPSTLVTMHWRRLTPELSLHQ